jgi:hypothetical protein
MVSDAMTASATVTGLCMFVDVEASDNYECTQIPNCGY